MLFSLRRHSLFAFLFPRLLGLIANVFSPKGLFGSLNKSTGQIVHILKEFSYFFYPTIFVLIILISNTAIFFSTLKKSIITPIIKKFSLDPSLPTNYRPISNLFLIYKILEKVVYFQLLPFFEAKNLLLSTQSGFHSFHSTETSLENILSFIFL